MRDGMQDLLVLLFSQPSRSLRDDVRQIDTLCGATRNFVDGVIDLRST